MTRPKDQGTAWETELVRRARDALLLADRLPEGGSHDRGDLVIHGRDGRIWIIEAKARQNGRPHRWLADARQKAGGDPVAVAWKRLVPTGTDRRRPDGERDVVILTVDAFLELLGGDL